jgi:DNA invertase Pin-like site-specific DNA recombinase
VSSFGKATGVAGAVIYCRVSTQEQTKNLSLATQRQACEEYCARQGLQVVAVFTDEGESAKTADRPELQNLLAFCGQNRGRVQHVVVYNLSRFARNSHDHHIIRALLKGYGITLRSATEPISDDASGKLIEGILANFAEFDNNLRADRTRAGMKAALQRGRWPFGQPVGYLRGRDALGAATIVADPERAPHVRRAFELMASAQFQKRQVLAIVTTEGLRTLKGKKLSPQTFGQMLRNPLYAGVLNVPSWGPERTRGTFEPIVNETLYEQVQAVLDGRKPSVAPHLRNHPSFPLRRFVRCGRCDTPLTGSSSTGRGGKYAYYHCRRRGCRGVYVPKVELEAGFVQYLGKLAPKPEYLKLFREIVLDTWREKQAEAVEVRRTLDGRLRELTERSELLFDAFVYKRAFDQATYDAQKTKLDQEIAMARTAAHDAELDELDIEGVVRFAEFVLMNAARLWQEMTLEQKQRLQQVLFPRGVSYGAEGFGTTETSLVYRLLHVVGGDDEREVSPAGFEPTLSA